MRNAPGAIHTYQLRREASNDDIQGDNATSKTQNYIKLVEERFPEIYNDFFKDKEDIFIKYLTDCREIAVNSGMATVDVLLISLLVRKDNLAIIFRPINSKTREQMKLQDSIGKDSAVSPKSSNFGPICGNITRFAELSKLSEQFDNNKAEIEKNNHLIENMLKRDREKIEQIKGKKQYPSEELINQKFLVSLPKIIKHEDSKYDLFFFSDDQVSNKAKCNAESKPHLAIIKSGKLLFYNYETEDYEEVSDNRQNLKIQHAKKLEILAYRSYEPLKEDETEVDQTLSKYKVVEKAIIPDYDIYSLGKKRIFERCEGLTAEDLATKEFDKLLDSLRFDKIDDMSTICYVDIEIIEELKKLTDDQVNHGAENTNSNTQNLSNLGSLVFTSQDHSDENIKLSVNIVKENEKEIAEKLYNLRKEGYDIAIGSRWGFDVDRENMEISTNQYNSQIKHWKEKSGEEKILIETLKKCCEDLFVESKQIDFKEFLKIGSEKFENNKIRKFIKSEYFSEKEISDIEAKSKIADCEGEKEFLKVSKIEEKLKLLINKLDIIAQEEKITQLKLAPTLVYGNYEDLNDDDKKIADEAKILYENKIKEKIHLKTEQLKADEFNLRKSFIAFSRDDNFKRIIAFEDEVVPAPAHEIRSEKDSIRGLEAHQSPSFLNAQLDKDEGEEAKVDTRSTKLIFPHIATFLKCCFSCFRIGTTPSESIVVPSSVAKLINPNRPKSN